MKNVLIPTDFTIQSLKLVVAAVQRCKDEKLNIILLHAFRPDNSISALLTSARRVTFNQLCTEEFREACAIIRNKYGKAISQLKVEGYYGSSRRYLKNFLEARAINAIFLSADYNLVIPSSSSVEMSTMLRASGYPLFWEHIQHNGNKIPVYQESISGLLYV